jgi:hypothetical protein
MNKKLIIIWIVLIFFVTNHPVLVEAGIIKFLGNNEKGRLIILLYDISTSPPKSDIALHDVTYEKIIEKLLPGDRFIIVEISDKSIGELIPVVDTTLPLTGVRLNDEEAAVQVKRELAETYKRIKREKRANRTQILDSLLFVNQIIATDAPRESKVLVIISDMLEDSSDYNFEKLDLTPKVIEGITNEKRKSKMLPNLQGVKVYVLGASSANTKKYLKIQEFWTRYFNTAGAQLKAYGRMVPNFD